MSSGFIASLAPPLTPDCEVIMPARCSDDMSRRINDAFVSTLQAIASELTNSPPLTAKATNV